MSHIASCTAWIKYVEQLVIVAGLVLRTSVTYTYRRVALASLPSALGCGSSQPSFVPAPRIGQGESIARSPLPLRLLRLDLGQRSHLRHLSRSPSFHHSRTALREFE